MAEDLGVYTADNTRYNSMEYCHVGKSGLKFPAISLGLWHNFGSKDDFDNMRLMCRTAFDHGITQFDLANNYGPVYGSAEENFGRLLEKDLKPYRDELIITTKAGYDMWPGPYGNWGSRKYLFASIDQSLNRMGLKYVDIFYHHRMDPNTPLEETMEALADIVKSGRALYAGVSNYDKEHTEQALKLLRALHCPFIVNQRRYSLFDRTIEQDGVKAYCKKAGLGIIAFSPLAQGLLTGKYVQGIPADSRIARDGRFLHSADVTQTRITQIKALTDLARRRGQTLAEMALSWILKDGEVCSVLIGASRPQQILDNIKAIENTSFTDSELSEIDKICAAK